jgi:HemY protein
MAELERAEHGDDGRAREWTLRAVRAALDPAWTADGYVSDRWRPVSPVTGRLDAFQWMVPVAALPGSAVEAAPSALPPPDMTAEALSTGHEQAPVVAAPENRPKPPSPPPPVFRARGDFSKLPLPPPVPPIVPIAHPPDDPGIDDDLDEEFAADGPDRAQPAGWRGFLSRMSR